MILGARIEECLRKVFAEDPLITCHAHRGTTVGGKLAIGVTERGHCMQRELEVLRSSEECSREG